MAESEGVVGRPCRFFVMGILRMALLALPMGEWRMLRNGIACIKNPVATSLKAGDLIEYFRRLRWDGD